MTPNQPPLHLSAAVPTATNPPSLSPSPPLPVPCSGKRKRQLTVRFSPGDATPTSTSTPPQVGRDLVVRKKSRGLPSLSECHACGFRASARSGKHCLQALYSEWRIVLLCQSCLLLVESSRICSYCFKKASRDCFYCSGCERSVHMSCFSDYRSVSPWSYSCSGSEFSVCVDCWVPKSMISSSGGSKSRRIGENSDNCRVSDHENDVNRLEDVENSCGVSDYDNEVDWLEEVAKNAVCNWDRKMEVAKRSRKIAMEKELVAIMMKDKATSVLELVATLGRDGTKVVDHKHSEVQLYKEVSSSPRMAENLCSVSLNCLAAPRMSESDRDMFAGVPDSGSLSVGGDIESSTNKLHESSDETVPEPSISIQASSPDFMINTWFPEDDGACPGQCYAEDENVSVDVALKEVSSSPRMAENLCSVSLNCLAAPRMSECDMDLRARVPDSGSPVVGGDLEASTNNKLHGSPDKSVPERSVFIRAPSPDILINTKCLKIDGMIDMSTWPEDDAEYESGSVDVPLKEVNSPPRVAVNLCSVSLNCFDVPRMSECDGNLSAGVPDSGSPGVGGDLEASTNKLQESPDKGVPEHSVSIQASSPNFLMNAKCLEIDGMVDMTTCPEDDGACSRRCEAEDENASVNVPLKEGEGSCSKKFMNLFGDNNCMDSESLPNHEQDKSTCPEDVDDGACPGPCDAEDENACVDVPLKEREGSCSNKFMNLFGDDNCTGSESLPNREQDKSTEVNAGVCNCKCDRYLNKYSKRRKVGNLSVDDSRMGQEQDKSTEANAGNCKFKPDRFLIKYSKRNKSMSLPGDNNSMDREQDKAAEDYNSKPDSLLIKYSKSNTFMSSPRDENSMDQEQDKSAEASAGDCNFKPDRFLIKYSKRNTSTSSSGDDNDMNREQDKSAEAGAGDCNYKPDRFLIKYRNRNKFMSSPGDDNSMDREQGKSTEGNAGNHIFESDRFLIKYGKRNKFMNSSGDGNSMDREQDRSTETNAGDYIFEPDRFLIEYGKRNKFITSDDDNTVDREQGKSTEANAGNHIFEPDRFSIKYIKRNEFMNSFGEGDDMDSESLPNPEHDKSIGAMAGSCNLKPDRFSVKYRKRRTTLKITRPGSNTKFFNKGLLPESQAPCIGLLLNCSKESRTFCDSSSEQCIEKLKTHLSHNTLLRIKPKRSMLLQREALFKKKNATEKG